MDLFQLAAENAALSVLAYDEYVLVDDNGDSEAHGDDTMSLELFKRLFDMVDVFHLASVDDQSVFELPGETDYSRNYELASEHSQKIIRTILKALWINELRGVCFTDFDVRKVRVTRSGKVKFRGVRIRTGLDSVGLEIHLRKNYTSALQIIEYLFDGNPPEEIQHLLDLIRNNYEFREIVHIHASLVPISRYSALFKEMYEAVKFIIPKQGFRDILLGFPYATSWKDSVNTSILLQYTLDFSPNSYLLPTASAKQTCLNLDKKKALQALHLAPEAKQRSLYPDQIRMTMALQFLEYLRSRFAHRMDYLENYTETYGVPFTARGSELSIRVRFPLVLSYMQLELFKHDRLGAISI